LSFAAKADAMARVSRDTLAGALLAVCLTLAGCAGTTPQDVLEEFARSLASANALYHTQCDGREEEALCVEAREHYNRIVDIIDDINRKAAE
jgi:hypothetical protein